MSAPHPFDPQVIAGQAFASRLPTAPSISFDSACSGGTCRGLRTALKAEAVG